MKGKPTESPSSAAADILAVVDAAGPAVTPPAAVPAGPVDPYVWKQAAAAVDPMAGVIARLVAAYPARAEEIAKGVSALGSPVVSRVPVKVAGGWEQKTLSTHQKYKLADGTILPLEV